MNLKQYLTENPLAELAEINTYENVLDTKQVGSGQARGYLVFTGDIWKNLKLIQMDIAHDLYGLADAVISTANDGSSFFGMDLTTASGQGNYYGLSMLVSGGVMTQPQADAFIDMRYSRTKPFANTTQAEFNWCKRQLSPTIKTIIKGLGSPTFTLNETLSDTVSVTFWGKATGFKTENLGRAIHVKEAQKYKVDLSGKADFDELEVRVNCSNVDFTVSY